MKGRPKGSQSKGALGYTQRTEELKRRHGDDCFRQWGKKGGNPMLKGVDAVVDGRIAYHVGASKVPELVEWLRMNGREIEMPHVAKSVPLVMRERKPPGLIRRQR